MSGRHRRGLTDEQPEKGWEMGKAIWAQAIHGKGVIMTGTPPAFVSKAVSGSDHTIQRLANDIADRNDGSLSFDSIDEAQTQLDLAELRYRSGMHR
jgi:hypothetical protein